MRRTRMVAGPAAPSDAPVIVSLTEFTARRARDLPVIAYDGLALARGWWALEGAIGVTLYIDARRRSGGSLSLWRSDVHLRRFIELERHAAIMRRYRDRVTVRSATWVADVDDVDITATINRRHDHLTG